MSLPTNGSCTASPLFQNTVLSYIAAQTDLNTANWWATIADPSRPLAQQLAIAYGDEPTAFKCGIGWINTCTIPSCYLFINKGEPAWAYHALVSMANLNAVFNGIWNGVTNGELTFSQKIDNVVQHTVPWKDPKFAFGDAGFWVVAAIMIMLSVGTIAQPEFGPAIAAGVGAVVGAGIQQAQYSLQPDPAGGIASRLATIEQLKNHTAVFGERNRKTLELWANNTYQGLPDEQNHTILDYIKNGAYEVADNLPSQHQYEQFYTKQLISRFVNDQWKSQKIFVTRMETDDPDDASGPLETRYYNASEGAVYYTYFYRETGVIKGYMDAPYGLAFLNRPDIGILGSDITKASAAAWNYGGLNYTKEMAFQQLQDSVASNGTVSPFKEGAAWSGTWTLPVCDMGKHNWNAKYGKQKSRMGTLPCCCGPNCADTSRFVKAANMKGFQTLQRACKRQLANSDLDFDDVNYGFKYKKSIKYAWATGSTAKRVGIAFAHILFFVPWDLFLD